MIEVMGMLITMITLLSKNDATIKKESMNQLQEEIIFFFAVVCDMCIV